MKTNYILLALKAPDFSKGEHEPSIWEKALADLTNKAKSTKGLKLVAQGEHERAWLIPRDTGLSFVAACFTKAEAFGVTPETWFLDEES